MHLNYILKDIRRSAPPLSGCNGYLKPFVCRFRQRDRRTAFLFAPKRLKLQTK